MKTLSLAIFLTIFFLTLTTPALAQTATAPAAGDGLPGNPYQIASLENLYWIAEDPGRWDKHYIQTEDIVPGKMPSLCILPQNDLLEPRAAFRAHGRAQS